MGRVRKKRRRKKVPGRNNGPARQRYRAEGRLQAHKILNLMRYNGLTRAEAYLLWTETRRRSR